MFKKVFGVVALFTLLSGIAAAQEKVLLEADGWNPPAQADGPPSNLNNPIYNKNLMDNIQRLKLNVETIVPVHYPGTRQVTFAEFTRAVAKYTSN